MKKILLAVLLLFMAGMLAAAFWFKLNFQTGKLQEKIIEAVLTDIPRTPSSSAYIYKAIGMEKPRTYLALFLNNTELRPGGGFIGSYGIIRVANGRPEILKIEGTEILDNSAAGIGEVPPVQLSKYLKIKTWQFRDSNWSPDFAENAKFALNLYKKEKGFEAENISGVIAVTPTLFEELLKITGPISVSGFVFNSENFTEKLEYEAEYGYSDRGLEFKERKKILEEFSHAVLPRLLTSSFTHWSEYMRLVPRMLKEKQIMLYAVDPGEQNFIISNGWGGEMKKTNNDYLVWTDANLGALKTDASISRTLSYTFSSSSVATVSMRYVHSGKFDWRTTRYNNYARIFVPKGSKLIRIDGAKDSLGNQDQGEENGYQWFGAFTSVEPGKTGQLSFTYELPPSVVEEIKNGKYDLVLQKQPGTTNLKLTLKLNFDKKLSTADPSEAPEYYGDSSYNLTTDLNEDKKISVSL